MTVDYQVVINLIATAAFTIVWYFYTKQVTDMDRMQNSFNDFRVDVPKNYVSKQELKDDLARIENTLVKILDKIDKKADRRSR